MEKKMENEMESAIRHRAIQGLSDADGFFFLLLLLLGKLKHSHLTSPQMMVYIYIYIWICARMTLNRYFVLYFF